MPGPGIGEAWTEPLHQSYDAEVAVAFTDKTWESVVITIEDLPIWAVKLAAEEKVLEVYSNHPTKAVSFVKTIWVGKEPAEEDMVETVGDEEEIT